MNFQNLEDIGEQEKSTITQLCQQKLAVEVEIQISFEALAEWMDGFWDGEDNGLPEYEDSL